jgi:hypothetical protein
VIDSVVKDHLSVTGSQISKPSPDGFSPLVFEVQFDTKLNLTSEGEAVVDE